MSEPTTTSCYVLAGSEFLPEAPRSLDADLMTDDELKSTLLRGLAEAERGEGIDAVAVFAEIGRELSGL